ncbi:MAG: 3-isopropylmalate dehydratase small subunit [Pyrinomonadaceae bacterium]|nr:3-isopropylmalate dehydratase small subunit [Pyrinomonadaceae bacterium]
MQKFITHGGKAAPLYQANIDTDQIIPKQFLKSIKRTGFGANLFNDWRFNSDGTPNEDFVLNKPKYEGASVLLAGKNFGCGSSREHAPWALEDYGFRVVIASAFADIFYNNCFKIGLLPIILPEEQVAALVKKAETLEDYQLSIDLENQKITDEYGFELNFPVDAFRKYCLLNGLDDIGLSLQNAEEISKYEKNRPGWKNF